MDLILVQAILSFFLTWISTVSAQASLDTLGVGLLHSYPKTDSTLTSRSPVSDAISSAYSPLSTLPNQDIFNQFTGADFQAQPAFESGLIDEIAAQFGHVIPSSVAHPGFPPSLSSPGEFGTNPPSSRTSNYYDIHNNGPSTSNIDATAFITLSNTYPSTAEGFNLKTVQDSAVTDALSIIQPHIGAVDSKLPSFLSPEPKEDALSRIKTAFQYSDAQIAKVSLPPVASLPASFTTSPAEKDRGEPTDSTEDLKETFTSTTESSRLHDDRQEANPAKPYPNVLPPPPSPPPRSSAKLPERTSYSPYETHRKEESYDRKLGPGDRFQNRHVERFLPSDARHHLSQRIHRQPHQRARINHRNPLNFSFPGYTSGQSNRGES